MSCGIKQLSHAAASTLYDAYFPADGHFACRGCGRPLYSAAAKFKSGCGWPAFDKCFANSVDITEDKTLEPMRIEITCAGCDGHHGHVFAGEDMTPSNERHCVNSVSVLFVDSPLPLQEETVTSTKKLALCSTELQYVVEVK